MSENTKQPLRFTDEECAFIKEMTKENFLKLEVTKNDLVKVKTDQNNEMNISAALKFTEHVSASMQWLMNDPNAIFGKVEDENAFIVITLLRDVEELDNGIDAKMKMSIMEKVAERLQEEPRLKPHLPL